MKHILLVLLSGILATVFVACENQQSFKVSGNTIKIGFIGPMSGSDEMWGKSGLLGSQIALQIKPYLMNGDRVELIVEDDRNSPQLAVAALRKLAVTDQVSAVLIMSDSETVLRLKEDAAVYKTPILALNATHPDITNSDYISQLTFNDSIQGTVAALYVIDELLIEHVAVFKDVSQPYSAFLADTFTHTFTEVGGTVELVEFGQGSTAHIDSLERLKDQGITFLYTPLTVEQILGIGLEIRKTSWHPKVMATDGLLSQFILQYDEQIAVVEGMLATDLYTTGVTKTAFGKEIYRIYQKDFKELGTTFTLLGSEGIALLMAAIDRCDNSSDRDCINRSLRKTNDFEGYLGKISIKENGQAERAIFINQIVNNHLMFIVKIY
ncbi:ABC transporter substrate-binding protein [Desulfosediminicola sp.]|uniref:ABC transporter substrate-binding protein n=1 Tax=Desulfosediminicola sp. TaxID=2886825 RepID=UPI003AF26A06